MREIINRRDPVTTEIWERDRAVRYYEANNEPYKVELIDAIPGDEPIRMYWHGHWQDLCRGPHLQHTGQLAGGCLQADERRGRLLARRQRPPDAPAHLRRRLPEPPAAEAITSPSSRRPRSATTAASAARWSSSTCRRKRRAGLLAPQRLDHLHHACRTTCAAAATVRAMEVNTPQVVDRKLWEASGHWEKYQREHVHRRSRRGTRARKARSTRSSR
jgi:threonyl-tRNA synthetase